MTTVLKLDTAAVATLQHDLKATVNRITDAEIRTLVQAKLTKAMTTVASS